MTTILIKKKDTAGAPAPGDLTNAAGGTEIAVNTATKRIYTKDSGGNVVELGTNSTSSTIDQLTVVTSTTLSYGTANQVQYLNASKLLVGSANLTFNGTTLTANTIGAFTLSGTIAGGGNQINNVIIGTTTPLAGAFTTLTASSTLTVTGAGSIEGLTVGRGAGAVSTNTVVGAGALAANTTGSFSTAIGAGALAAQNGAVQNVAVGNDAAGKLTVGNQNTAVGISALGWNGASATTGNYNSAYGQGSLTQLTSGSYNVAAGSSSLGSNTTASYNVAIGASALGLNTVGQYNVSVGHEAGYSLGTNAAGINNTAVGYQALYWSQTTSANNTAVGFQALNSSSGNNFNASTAVGSEALKVNTAGSNTALGYRAGYINTSGTNNVFVGIESGVNNTTGSGNTFVGRTSGLLSTGSYNCFVGQSQSSGYSSGYEMTTGSKNTILGGYSGNQGSLDIRTLSNYIVLSDGDGVPKFVNNGSSANSLPGTSVAYNSSSGTFDSTLQIGSNLQLMSFAAGANTQSQFGSNVYYNGGYRAIAGGAGSSKLFIGAAGVFEFAGAASLTSAGDLITYTKTLDCGGLAQTVALQGGTSVTGTGISFPATQFASSNANTLDDYEEGTWSPNVYHATSNNASWSVIQGKYTKIGNVVSYWLNLDGGNSGTAGSDLVFTLPIAYATGTNWQQFGAVNASSGNFGAIQQGSSSAVGRVWTSGGATTAQVTFITISGSYTV